MYNRNLHFHFTGIGGVGMSGIAEVLLNLGFKVSGSDIKNSAVVEKLRGLGAAIAIGHAAENIPEGASLLVYSSAVQQENPELVAARERSLPIIRRAEVLAELMRLKYSVGVAGSHGKTTTTSMIAAIMERGGLDPTVIIGGQVKALDGGARVGKGQFLVAETDESDRSFLLLHPTIAVVTNIDHEHLEAYSSLTEMEQSFAQFVESVPFYGLAVLCVDDPKVREIADRYPKRKITFGFSPDADLRATNISFDRTITTFDVERDGDKIMSVALPIPGRHMASNALAAIAVGLEFGLSAEVIASALNGFRGVSRRIEIIGEEQGITILNDYGHHPTEIRATLAAIRTGWNESIGRLHVVFQPHRYSRTKSCFVEFLEAFNQADNLLVNEIYAASEEPLEGISGQSLCDAITHPSKQFIATPDDCIGGLTRELKAGDFVVCLGAGSIGALPEKLLSALINRAK